MDDDKSGQRDGEVSEEGFVFVFDRREKNGKSVKLSLGGLFGFQEFRGKVRQVSYVFSYLDCRLFKGPTRQAAFNRYYI